MSNTPSPLPIKRKRDFFDTLTIAGAELYLGASLIGVALVIWHQVTAALEYGVVFLVLLPLAPYLIKLAIGALLIPLGAYRSRLVPFGLLIFSVLPVFDPDTDLSQQLWPRFLVTGVGFVCAIGMAASLWRAEGRHRAQKTARLANGQP